jgi:transposase-like protein
VRNIYTRETKDKAKALYIQGKTFAHIAREIGCNSRNISKWSQEESWPEDRAKVYVEGTALANQKASILISDRTTQQMQAYQEMLTKGIRALQETNVKSAGEAAQLIDKAIKGIGAIRQDALQVSFIEEVAAALKSEISDRDVLRRIGEKLRKAFEKYRHNKPVDSQGK